MVWWLSCSSWFHSWTYWIGDYFKWIDLRDQRIHSSIIDWASSRFIFISWSIRIRALTAIWPRHQNLMCGWMYLLRGSGFIDQCIGGTSMGWCLAMNSSSSDWTAWRVHRLGELGQLEQIQPDTGPSLPKQGRGKTAWPAFDPTPVGQWRTLLWHRP